MSDPTPDELTRRLRAGDPAAADPGLDRSARAAIRRRIVAARARRRHVHRWLLPAATAAALLVLMLGLAWRSSAPQPTLAATARSAPLPPSAGDRQIQFTTAGGTLVVWVLQPRTTS